MRTAARIVFTISSNTSDDLLELDLKLLAIQSILRGLLFTKPKQEDSQTSCVTLRSLLHKNSITSFPSGRFAVEEHDDDGTISVYCRVRSYNFTQKNYIKYSKQKPIQISPANGCRILQALMAHVQVAVTRARHLDPEEDV